MDVGPSFCRSPPLPWDYRGLMSKRLVRICMAAGCRVLFLLKTAERRVRGRLTVLCYHRVLSGESKADYFIPDLVVTPDSFRQQCLTLRQYYDVLPLHRAVAMLHAGHATNRPLAAVTFDDGYRDNFHYAAPVLRDTGIPATFFVIANLVGTRQSPWYDQVARAVADLARRGRLHHFLSEWGMPGPVPVQRATNSWPVSARRVVAEAKKLAPARRARLVQDLLAAADAAAEVPSSDLIMDWEQLVELSNEGHEIGSHGAAHEILTQLDDASLEAEIAGSRRTIADRLGKLVRSFCYPNGSVDERVARAVQQAGYGCAVTTESGNNGPEGNAYLLRRWFIHEDRLATVGGRASDTLLRMEVSGLADQVFLRRQKPAKLP